MLKKVYAVILSFVLLLSLSACGSSKGQPMFNKDAKNGIPDSTLISENEKYRLEFDADNMGLILTDKVSGTVFSSTPEKSSGEEFDELGMPIKKHPQVESVIKVEYLNSATNTVDTLLSYTGAVKNGRVRCGKTKSGLRVEFYFDDADIMIPVDYSLCDTGAVIGIDPTAIQEGKNKVHTVSVAPFWCSAENDAKDSYLFVPSGSGAIVEPKTRSQQGDAYSAQVYGEDYAIEKKVSISESEGVKLPVYGVKTGEKGVCAIIDKGAESAWIDLVTGSETFGFSGVCAKFQLRGYTDHTAKLFSSTEVENVVHSKLMITTPVSVIFCPLIKENANYSGMAKTYREYLIRTQNLEATQKEVLLNLNLIGGASVTRSFLGVPYSTTLAVTTVSDTEKIINSVKSKLDSSFSVCLKGFSEQGIDIGTIGGDFTLNGNIGSKKELKALAEKCSKSGTDLYMNYDIVRFSESGNGFSKNSDSVINAGEQTATQYLYDIAVRNQMEKTIHYLLSPSKIGDAAQKVKESAEEYSLKGVSLDTLSYMSYSDYENKDKSDYYAKSGFSDVAVKALKKVNAKNKLMTTSANAYSAVLADIITDVPFCSSGEYLFSNDVPFYQMVFKGYVPMTSKSLNLADDGRKILLNAVEGGTGISYTVINKWDNALIDSPYRVFFGSVYSKIEDDIADNAFNLRDYFDSIKGATIVSHKILDNGLRLTVFSNGICVYTNYTEKAVDTKQGKVDAMSYLVWEGAE